MKVLMFSVFDRLAEAHLPPFVSQTNATAIRQFQNSVNEPGHPFNAHAHDYDLYRIGEFDDGSGHITEDRVMLENGQNLKNGDHQLQDVMDGVSRIS